MSFSSLPAAAVRHFALRLRWAGAGILIFLLTVVITMPACAAGSVAELDRQNGLPDAQLGASVNNFQGLEKTEDLGRFQTYKRPADKLRYGKYEVRSITYNFFKGQLYSIVIGISGKGNVKGIYKMLEQSYGKDHTNDTLPVAKTTLTVEVREWAGTKAYCVMKSGSDNDGGELRFIDKPTWDQLEAPRREKLQANKAMLGGSFVNGDLDKRAVKPTPTDAPAPAEAPTPAPSLAPAPAVAPTPQQN